MIFKLEEEHISVKAAAREFALTRLKPGVIDRDSAMIYPTEFVKEMGEMGFLSMMADPSYGGSGMDTLSYVIAMEEISKIDSSCSVIMSINNSLVIWGLEKYGTEDQKQKYIPRLTSGDEVGCFCLSEPEAGSDATSQRTSAIDMGDHYLLNGVKNWITSGGKATIHVTIPETCSFCILISSFIVTGISSIMIILFLRVKLKLYLTLEKLFSNSSLALIVPFSRCNLGIFLKRSS